MQCVVGVFDMGIPRCVSKNKARGPWRGRALAAQKTHLIVEVASNRSYNFFSRSIVDSWRGWGRFSWIILTLRGKKIENEKGRHKKGMTEVTMKFSVKRLPGPSVEVDQAKSSSNKSTGIYWERFWGSRAGRYRSSCRWRSDTIAPRVPNEPIVYRSIGSTLEMCLHPVQLLFIINSLLSTDCSRRRSRRRSTTDSKLPSRHRPLVRQVLSGPRRWTARNERTWPAAPRACPPRDRRGPAARAVHWTIINHHLQIHRMYWRINHCSKKK